MAKIKTSVYGLLLFAVLFLACAVLSVGETQARYANTVVWNTYMEPAAEAETEPAADLCVISDSDLTVLLGEMGADSYEVEFFLQSTDAGIGNLVWFLDQPNDLEVRISMDGVDLDSGASLELTAGIPVRLTMTLSKIRQEPAVAREAKTVQVTVGWLESRETAREVSEAEILRAVFCTELPAVEAAPEDTPDPDDTESEEDGGDPGDGGSEGSAPEEDGTEDAVTGEEGTEDSGPENSNDEGTGPGEKDGESTAGSTDNEVSQVDVEVILPVHDVMIETLADYDPTELLPVWITVEDDATVCLGFGSYPDAVSPIEMVAFPQGTRYQLAQDEGWHLLYQADTVTLELAAGTHLLLLDLSGTEMAVDAPSSLMARAWSETTQPGEAVAGASPGVSETFTMDSRILSTSVPMKIVLTDLWQIHSENNSSDYQFTYSVERLSVTETEELGYQKEYVPMELAENSLTAGLITGEMGQTLTFQIGNILPPAGTYRVNMEWKYKEICIKQTQVTFFINYAHTTNTAQTGGAEQ